MLSVPRGAGSPRRRRRGLDVIAAVAAACAVLTASALAWGVPAVADGADDTGAATAEAGAADAAELVVAALDPVVRASTETVTFEVLVRAAEANVPAGTVELRLAADPAADADALGTAASAESEAALIATAAVDGTAAGEERTATIAVPRTDLPLAPLDPSGVYAVQADYTPTPADGAPEAGAEPSLTATGSLVWRGAAGEGVDLSVVVPIVLPSEVRTLPTRAQLDAAVPAWDELLTAAEGASATLAIDPRVIAGIRAYGDEASEAARAFLARLEGTPLDAFLLQFADADPAAQAALGYTTLLGPTSLDFVTRFGSFAGPETTPGADAASTDTANADTDTDAADADAADSADDAGSDAVGADPAPDLSGETDADAVAEAPDLAALLSWDEATPTGWPAAGAADAATLELLADAGIDRVVLDSTVVRGAGTPRATLGGGAEAIVTDADLDAAARAALGGATTTERAAGFADLAAALALASAGAGDEPATLALGLDRGAVGDAEDPAQLLEMLEALGWVDATAIGAQPTGTASLASGGTSESRTELLRAAAGRENAVDEIGAVLVNPEYLSGYQRTRLLELFATRHAADDEAFRATAAAYQERDAELLEGVRAITTEHTQLVGASTRMPLQIHNSLPFDARVTVRVDPSSAALSLAERTFEEVLVPAEGNENVLVPVHARVSSGESGLVVSVSAVSGDPTVYTGTLAITVRASIEAIGLWTLGALVALLLGFGIWRSVRRRTRGIARP